MIGRNLYPASHFGCAVEAIGEWKKDSVPTGQPSNHSFSWWSLNTFSIGDDKFKSCLISHPGVGTSYIRVCCNLRVWPSHSYALVLVLFISLQRWKWRTNSRSRQRPLRRGTSMCKQRAWHCSKVLFVCLMKQTHCDIQLSWPTQKTHWYGAVGLEL